MSWAQVCTRMCKQYVNTICMCTSVCANLYFGIFVHVNAYVHTLVCIHVACTTKRLSV